MEVKAAMRRQREREHRKCVWDMKKVGAIVGGVWRRNNAMHVGDLFGGVHEKGIVWGTGQGKLVVERKSGSGRGRRNVVGTVQGRTGRYEVGLGASPGRVGLKFVVPKGDFERATGE